jgi:integrase
MLWSHLDGDRWIIPKTKNGEEHRFSLSDDALAALEQMPPLRDASGVVFSGQRRGKPTSNAAMAAGARSHWSLRLPCLFGRLRRRNSLP